jgi:nickel-dependent lactate racemase
MKRIKVPYKQEFITVEIPDKHLADVLEPNEVTIPEVTPHQMVLDSLMNPSVPPNFNDFLQLPGKLLIIVNDGTRPTPTRIVLEALKDYLVTTNVEFIVATGVHRGPTFNEYQYIFGDMYDLFANRIHVHDARIQEELHYIGTSRAGTELWLNNLVVHAEKILVIGSVEPHYFAGYTGGRKAFLPGTAGYISIEQNHKLALSPNAKALALEGNPVHEDMMDALKLFTHPIFSIMTVLNKNQEIHGVFSGSLDGSFYAAIDCANSIFVADIQEKVDVVVTASKYPMDVDLYQAQKAIDNAKLALKNGGTMILVASCREGIGEEAFLRLLSQSDTPQAVLHAIEAGYKLGYHKAAKMAEVFQWATVQAITDLDDALLESIFIQPVHNLQDAIDHALEVYGKDCKVLFLLDGAVTVPRIR